MLRYLTSSAAAWAAVMFLAVEIGLPYYLQRARAFAVAGSSPFRERLRPHYWLGYALAALSTVHGSLVGPAMARSDQTGIWAATFAWGLLFVQVALGLALQGGTANRRRVRRIHFWSMLLLSGLVVVHVWRNG
jgi:hypothetical protein